MEASRHLSSLRENKLFLQNGRAVCEREAVSQVFTNDMAMCFAKSR
jgi:hypothetical protein